MKKIIVGLSPGRSGSTTLYKNISEIFNLNNHSGIAYHHNISDQESYIICSIVIKQKKKKKFLVDIRNIILKWKKGNCYVGASYSHIFDEILKIHGKKM